ncbi:EAL domain-containing protein [Thiorhodococcus mannitoliphagus]|uniref:EAL domain-containing protein n=1 Tax=Thiorhodococcus mannitoliphagus TaxID=329406 RepID=A0A6P1DQT2_9GAMM|nr:EAL domain-containing protein [Thiorhodococcus mannitoliphagus]NEX19291.1 EAL domain-containing protein [Thiorhodococcus mannitoliphagus]
MKAFSTLPPLGRFGGWRPFLLPAMILAIGLMVTAGLWSIAQEDVRQDREQELDELASKVAGLIDERLRDNVQLLRGAAALFDTPEWITHERFRRYFEGLNLQDLYPGIQGIGFLLLIPDDEKDARVAAVHREGFPQFEIHPEGERAFYAAVLYIERFSGRNLRDFGYDMAPEPRRWEAATRARDEDRAALSARVTLKQEDATDVQPGFVLFLPVYRANAPHDSLAERRANLLGWVYSPLRMHDLMQDVLRPVQSDLEQPGLRLDVYAGERPAPEQRLFTSGPARISPDSNGALRKVQLVAFGGRQWSVAVTVAPFFKHDLSSDSTTWIGLSGLTLSLLLALLVALRTQAQQRVAIAMGALEGSNQHLAEQERALLWAQRTAQLGSWTFDPNTRQASWSEGMFPIWGLNPKDGPPSYEAHRRYIHPDDWAAFDQAVRRAAERGEPYRIKLRIRRPDGEERTMISICTPNLDAQGKVVRLSGTVQDVTEREELYSRIERIAAHVPGVIYQYQQWLDGRTAFPYASAGIRDIYGVEPAEVATDATAVFDVLHPDDRPEVAAKIAESMHHLTTWRDSFRVKRPEGRVIWVEGEASPELQADGSVQWHGYIRDITDRKQAEVERRHLQTMLARTEQLAHVGSWEMEVETNSVSWSEELFRIFQMDPAEGVPPFTEHHRLFCPEDFARLKTAMDAVIKEGTPYALELRARRRDGSTRQCFARGYPEAGSNRSVTHVYGTFEDLTERKQAERDLRLAASVFAHSFEAIIITDAENRIVDTNPAFSAITGYERASVLGKDPNILASGRHDEAFYREMWDAITQTGAWQGEIWNRHKDGEIYAELLAISTVQNADDSVQNYIGVFSDISELKAHQAELDRIANYDHLTGLPNRRLLSDRLEQAVARTRRSGRLMAICYLDLDDFKPINDQYGHEVGDQVLIGIANQLRKLLRAQDTVARLGGDEFVLLFNDLARAEDSYVLLERVLATATSPIVVRGVSHRVSASIGVTLSPPDVESADILLRHADQAMYRAKDAGRNRYHLYDAEQDRLIQDRRLKLECIKDALSGQEFELYYQPKVDMVSREVIGVEALIRWQHPEKGLLLPSAFLPIVEGSDLEIAIGEWVIATALSQVASWQRQGLKLPVSVNISAGHLLQPSFAKRLERLLAEHPECDPGCLEMEILETSALSDIVRAGQTLTACHALGLRFALDDFGTGYSSLAYFRRLPIDVLKIDQSFVRDMLDDPEDMEIVESVVRLAQAFKRSVIAEGVETPEHGALLTSLGCRLGQGFGIARPMPAAAIPVWVSTWPEQGDGMVVDEGVSKDDIPLMMAMQNHRRWVDEFVDALNDGDIARLTEIDRDPCRFERWYQGSGSTHYGALEAFEAIGRSHLKVHELASGIMALAEHGEMASAQERLPSLFEARDALIGHLGELILRLETAGE